MTMTGRVDKPKTNQGGQRKRFEISARSLPLGNEVGEAIAMVVMMLVTWGREELEGREGRMECKNVIATESEKEDGGQCHSGNGQCERGRGEGHEFVWEGGLHKSGVRRCREMEMEGDLVRGEGTITPDNWGRSCLRVMKGLSRGRLMSANMALLEDGKNRDWSSRQLYMAWHPLNEVQVL